MEGLYPDSVRDNVPADICGRRCGNAKVSMLLAMPSAKGLFHRAATQRWARLRSTMREDANELTNAMMAELGIAPNRVDELRSVPVNRLLSAMAETRSERPPQSLDTGMPESPRSAVCSLPLRTVPAGYL